jgi:hypothetical protein
MGMTTAQIQARLALIDLRLDELYGTPVKSLSIADRAASLRDIKELEDNRDKYQAMLDNVAGVRPATIEFQTPI